MVIDTDVIIWYLRGNEKAFQLIENSEKLNQQLQSKKPMVT